MLFVPLGTGLASAILCRGQLVTGSLWTGEIGHVVVAPDGPLCGCGQRGCLEALSSAGAIGRRWSEATGLVGDAEEVARRVEAGEPEARRIWQEAVDALASMLAPIVAGVGTELVLIGGGLVHAGDTLLAPLRDGSEGPARGSRGRRRRGRRPRRARRRARRCHDRTGPRRPMIITVTPNPALDITYAVPSVALGASHRVASVSERAGARASTSRRCSRRWATGPSPWHRSARLTSTSSRPTSGRAGCRTVSCPRRARPGGPWPWSRPAAARRCTTSRASVSRNGSGTRSPRR